MSLQNANLFSTIKFTSIVKNTTLELRANLVFNYLIFLWQEITMTIAIETYVINFRKIHTESVRPEIINRCLKTY